MEIIGTNDKPVIALSNATITIADSSDSDSQAALIASANINGLSQGEDVDQGDTLAFQITLATGAAASTTSTESGFDIVQQGLYGALHINQTTGDYKYIPDSAAVNALSSTENESFTIQVNDAFGASATSLLTVTVDGVNDRPVIEVTRESFSFTDSTYIENTSGLIGYLGAVSNVDMDYAILESTGSEVNTASTESGFDVALSGEYGTLHVNVDTGASTYIVDATKLSTIENYDSVRDTFNIKVNDANDTLNDSIDIVIENDNGTYNYSHQFDNLGIAQTGVESINLGISSGTLLARGFGLGNDVDTSDSLTYQLYDSAGSAVTNSSDEAGYDVALAGEYGVLYLNANTGRYKFIPEPSAIDALSDDASELYNIGVMDAGGLVSTIQALTVNVEGVNDIPEISTDLANIMITDTGAADNVLSLFEGSEILVGATTVTERDLDQTHEFFISDEEGVNIGSTTTQSGYDYEIQTDLGTFYVNGSNGNYSFIPVPSEVDKLIKDELKDEAFFIATTDSEGANSQPYYISVDFVGENDIPTVSINNPLFTINDTDANDTLETIETTAVLSGQGSSADADAGDIPTYNLVDAVDSDTTGFSQMVVGTYGTLYLDEVDGDYKFIPLPTAINRLTSTQTETFSIFVKDGYDGESGIEQITVSVVGVNDQPNLSISKETYSFNDTSAFDAVSISDITTGTSTVTERDLDQTHEYQVSDAGTPASSAIVGYDQAYAGEYGTLHINSNSGSYVYVPNDDELNGLKTQATESFNLTAIDSGGLASVSETVDIVIDGVNDIPIVAFTGSVGEYALTTGTTTATVFATATDADYNEVLTDTTEELPSWVNFSATDSGAVAYEWQLSEDSPAWLNGTKVMLLKVNDGTNEASVSVTVKFTCDSAQCNEFAQSEDTVTPVTPDDANVDNFLTSGGLKIDGNEFSKITESEYQDLFDGTSGTGEFRVVYSAEETGEGATGIWNIDQVITANYNNGEVKINGAVNFSNIAYFEGADEGNSGNFNYLAIIDYSNPKNANGTFDPTQTAVTTANTGLTIDNQSISVEITDILSFLYGENNKYAGVIATQINPSSDNPAEYKDEVREMIAAMIRTIEPQ